MTSGRVGPRPHGRPHPAQAGQAGQATVELALVLPLIALLLLVVVQAGLVVRDQLLVTNAAREAARAFAVDPGTDVNAVVRHRTGLGHITASIKTVADTVRVDVHAEIPIRVPLLALLRPVVGLDGTATMRLESG